MDILFTQGLITYPSTGLLQQFLTISGGYVSLSTINGQTDITFAQGTKNYIFSETADVANAWGPITPSVDTWLYWDIDLRTAVRTFGQTIIQPIAQASTPSSPVEDMHWFNTATKRMYVYINNFWREVIRVFAAKINTVTLTPLGSGFPQKPFAGTQVGLSGTPVTVARIIVDETGAPISRSDKTFFTTQDLFFLNGSSTNAITVEASATIATALVNISKFTVVKFSQFGKIEPALYNDIQTTTIAILMEDLVIGETGSITLQGLITNSTWNWTTVGAPLWIDNAGALVQFDPHVVDALTYPTGKPPVARVVTQTSVIFDQGLGGKGDKGDATDLSAKVNRAGDTMTGYLILNANPTLDLGAATKQYVDSSVVGLLPLTGGTLTGNLTVQTPGSQPIAVVSTNNVTSGLLVVRTGFPAAPARFEWDETTDSWLIGTTGSMNPVATGGSVSGKADKVSGAVAGNFAGLDVTGNLTDSGYNFTSFASSSALTSGLALKVNKSGDTMTGNLAMSNNKVTGLAAATVNGDAVRYDEFNSHTTDGSVHLTPNENAFLDALNLPTLVAADVNQLAGVNIAATYFTQAAAALKVNKTGDTMTGFLILNANPTLNLGAATKQYVDNIAAGLIVRAAVKAATTVNIAATYFNGASGVGATLNLGPLVTLDIDNVTSWTLGDGVLFKNQTSAAQNGRYDLTQVGSGVTDWIFTRSTDVDQATEIPRSYMFVINGTANQATAWVLTVANAGTFVVGTDDIIVEQFSIAVNYFAGTGLILTGTTFSLDQTITDSLYVNVTGDTMTGNLNLGGFKVVGLAAATGTGEAVRYDEFNAHTTDATVHLTANQNTLLDGLNLPTLVAADINQLAGITVANDSLVVHKVGDTMTGNLSMSGLNKIINLAAATVNGDAVRFDEYNTHVTNQDIHTFQTTVQSTAVTSASDTLSVGRHLTLWAIRVNDSATPTNVEARIVYAIRDNANAVDFSTFAILVLGTAIPGLTFNVTSSGNALTLTVSTTGNADYHIRRLLSL